MEVLERVLETIRRNSSDDNPVSPDCPHHRRFKPTKEKHLLRSDQKTIAKLNAVGHESISLCICDPDLHDCPIVFASDGFCNFTGYDHTEIEGKSCRFLQGPGTRKSDVDVIRSAIKHEVDTYVTLLNYRKDGTPFRNHFFMSPIHDKYGKLLYFIGVQCFPEKLGDKDEDTAPKNIGWGYTSSRIAFAARLAQGAEKIPKHIGLYDVNEEIEEIMEETEAETEVSSSGSDEETKISSNVSESSPKIIEYIYPIDESLPTNNSDDTRPDPPGARIDSPAARRLSIPTDSSAAPPTHTRSAASQPSSQKRELAASTTLSRNL